MGICARWVAACSLALGMFGCADEEAAQSETSYVYGPMPVAQVGTCGPAGAVGQCLCGGGVASTQVCEAATLTWGACACAIDGTGSGGQPGSGSGSGGNLGGGQGGGTGGSDSQQGSGGTVGAGGTDGAMGGGQPANDGSLHDGDGAVVTAPFACGPSAAIGIGTTNVSIGGRDVLIEYPCDHREGADMIFILNLHGTMAMENVKLYQHGYFAIHNHLASHNFIVAAPKAIGSQWGNEGGAADTQHLHDVIAYVYDTFSQFNIKAMWIGGHSWGAMYTRTFVCDAGFADRVQGAILMSGNPEVPDCSDRLSVIGTLAENDITALNVPQDAVAAGHGCGPKQTDMVGNNVHDVWPGCSSGHVHANYLMLGKGHSDFMDAEVVASIADEIREAHP